MSELPQLQPYDQHNQALERQVHPPDWTNPQPAGTYNLVVIGGGTAGLVASAGAAGLGAKVALIERELLGGDCLNVGCIPSKGVISAARVAATVRDGAAFGVHAGETRVDFGEAMARMRQLRAQISPHDSAARFRDLGVDVFLGAGRFTSPQTIDVDGQTLRFKKAVIATGARAAALPIPGLAEVGALTNESVFSLTQLPERLVVIGGGPIGTEMAQSFARFGTQVTQIEKNAHILPREDADAAQIVQASLERDGVQFRLAADVIRLTNSGSEKGVVIRTAGREQELRADEVLVGVGRAPNVQDLGLETAGVRFDERLGVQVNARLQTTNPRIFAAGDVASKYQFTHAADFMARMVIQNALFFGRANVNRLLVPWCTYTSPELAHVGQTADQARRNGTLVDTYEVPLSSVDRAILAGETEGFVRVHCRHKSDRIMGATVVAPHAGEMIGELTLAMQHGIGLKKIGATIHPYPTQAEAIRKLGDQYNRTRLTPTIQRLFRGWLRWSRR